MALELLGEERVEDVGGDRRRRARDRVYPTGLKPGEYELRASYLGEERIYVPSRATTPFTIDKEDAGMTLEIDGKGKKRTRKTT